VLPPHLTLNFKKAEDVITAFIRSKVNEAGASGVVVGVSGGGDSAVATALAVKALGRSSVLAVHMPEIESDRYATVLASKVADYLGLELKIIDITKPVSTVLESLGLSYSSSKKIVRGNVKARVRAVLLYAIANNENLLVLGTSDRSEWLIGFFTKWGDGAADLYPIVGLYKSQVREFAKYLNLPAEVISKPPAPDLWPGHTAEGELGLTYDVIDEVLYRYFDEGIPAEQIPKVTGISKEAVNKVLELHRKSQHKRTPLQAPFTSFKEL